MRILEIETFGRGGLIHYAYNLSCALAERGHSITLITHCAYELEDRSLPAGVEVVKAIGRLGRRLEGRWPGWITALTRKFEAIGDAFAVARKVRRRRPDVIHLHCTNPISLAYVELLRRTGVPLVVTAHVVTPHEPIPLQNAVYRRVHQGSPRIIAHSDFDRRRLVEEFGVEEERVAVIPHGEYGFFERGGEAVGREEARRGLGLAADSEVALFFGYIREYKGLDLLLDAWPAVAAARPAARLVVAGDPVRLPPERRRQLQDQAERLGVLHRFGYLPFSDVAGYFAAADVLVMPYRHISQSGVLYLALSLDVPVLATRVGALPETLSDGESGLLVPPESPEALAEGVIRLLGDTGLRERLAAGGRAVAQDHSWPAIAQRTERLFADLVADYRPRS